MRPHREAAVLAAFAFVLALPVVSNGEARFDQALKNGNLARESLRASHAFLIRWMDRRDDGTQLLRGGPRKDRWTVRETATRLLPQLVLAAHLTGSGDQRRALEQTLRQETVLTARLLRLPDDYDLSADRFLYSRSDTERIVSASAEYAAEGLSAVTGRIGTGPWLGRVRAIVDDIFSLASLETPFASGPLPSSRAEVNGNLLRILPGLSVQTGDPGYLELARRIGDAYCLGILPANGGVPASEWSFTAGKARNAALSLNGAGYPIVEGLTMLCAIEAGKASPRAPEYTQAVARMLNALLGAARSPEGLFYARIEPNGRGGYAVDRKNRSSAWPRLLAACLRFGAISGDSRFVAPAEEVLQGLPGIHARIWRNRPEILARDAPGILNLVALALRDDSTPGRPNLGRTLDWLDRESAKIRSALKDPSRSLKESHDGLFARATLAHAWFLSAGTRLVPWREDLVAGANVTGDTLDVVLQSEALWDGTLLFDSRGLRDPATLATDTAYEPGLPTRFPIEPGEDYSIQISGAGGSAIWNGTLLGQGLRVSVDPASGHHIRIVKLPSHLPPSPADTDADSTLTIEPQSPF